MSDSYTTFCTVLPVVESKRQMARDEMNTWMHQLRKEQLDSGFIEHEDDFDVGFECDVTHEGVELSSAEHGDASGAIDLIMYLQDVLQDDTPHIVTWAYTCSKMHPDQFSGGGALLRRDIPPLDLDVHATLHYEQNRPRNMPIPLKMLKEVVSRKWSDAQDDGVATWAAANGLDPSTSAEQYEYALELYAEAHMYLKDATLPATIKFNRVQKTLGEEWEEKVKLASEYTTVLRILMTEQWDTFPKMVIK